MVGKKQATTITRSPNWPPRTPKAQQANATKPIHQNFSMVSNMRKQFSLLVRIAQVTALLLTFCAISYGQGTSVVLAPLPEFQAWSPTGLPLAFGCVFTYRSGTTTQLATYSDYTGTIVNDNPVTLSASGTADIWLQSGQAYRIVVKSNGGTDCSLGTVMYTVDGVGGGGTQLTTVIGATSGSVTFVDQSQNQLFQVTLTGDMVGLPISAVGVVPPGVITFQITQDSVGGHAFTWPANAIGGCTIAGAASSTSVQTFIWDGTNAYAISGCVTGAGPTMSVGNIYDYGLLPNSIVCTDANQLLSTTCGSINAITVNGQTITQGGNGNVNVGAAVHSLALNQGNGNPLTGLTLGANAIPMGAAGADPVAKSIPSCSGNQAQTFDGTTWTCITTTVITSTITKTIGTVSIAASPTITNVATQAVTMPASGCPCRALVNWVAYGDTGNAGQMAVAVSDGTNTFATGGGNTTGSTSEFYMAATGVSPGTYANGANITFTMKASQTMTSANIHGANTPGVGQSSNMQITILTSN